MNNNDSVLVSVLMPVYNQENLVIDSIVSVINQTYDSIEVIICDDSSSDNTVQIVESFISKYTGNVNLFFYKNEENVGITKNLNFLINKARGEYISFFSGDDLMLPEKIKRQVEHLNSDLTCFISYHDVRVFDSNSGNTLYMFSHRHKPREGGVESLVKYLSFNCGCATMVRMKNKIYCDESIMYASDWLHFVEILAVNNGSIKYIDEVLGGYRRHSSNITDLNLLNGYMEVFDSLDIITVKYPKLSSLARITKGERLMTYGFRLVSAFRIRDGLTQFVKGLRLSPISIIGFSSTLLRYLKR